MINKSSIKDKTIKNFKFVLKETTDKDYNYVSKKEHTEL